VPLYLHQRNIMLQNVIDKIGILNASMVLGIASNIMNALGKEVTDKEVRNEMLDLLIDLLHRERIK
jgi:hypothetical protein